MTRMPHHWEQGPQDVQRVPKFWIAKREYQWKFRWYLDKVEGCSRPTAIAAIYTVLRHPLSWERTGVRWVRTPYRERANILVNVVPQDTTACGPGSAGCYSWGRYGPPTAAVGVEHIYNPQKFAELVNMELCGHGTFRMLDMYNAVHQQEPYEGVMGTWSDAAKTAYFPSDTEIAAAQLWLQGRATEVSR